MQTLEKLIIRISYLFVPCYKGYKNIMENCMENARVLKEGLIKMNRFNIISKDVGVPLVAFSLIDSSKHTVFEISESLRRFGWIIPAYTLPPDAQHVAVLRVVIREDFSHSLAERLINDMEKVLQQIDSLPSRISTKAAHVTAASLTDTFDEKVVSAAHGIEKGVKETLDEVTRNWRKVVDHNKTSGVC